MGVASSYRMAISSRIYTVLLCNKHQVAPRSSLSFVRHNFKIKIVYLNMQEVFNAIMCNLTFGIVFVPWKA